MSTRSMTVVRMTQGGTQREVNLYRHCDGYAVFAGADLLKAVAAAKAAECGTADDVVAALLAGGNGYQVVFHKPEEQGDLEHVYVATLGRRGWTITHYARTDWRRDHYTRWVKVAGNVATFMEHVNAERAGYIARARERGVEAGVALLRIEAGRVVE